MLQLLPRRGFCLRPIDGYYLCCSQQQQICSWQENEKVIPPWRFLIFFASNLVLQGRGLYDMQSIVMQDEEAGLSVNQPRIEMFSCRAKDRRLPSLDPDRRYFPSAARQIIYHHCASRCGTTNSYFSCLKYCHRQRLLSPAPARSQGTRHTRLATTTLNSHLSCFSPKREVLQYTQFQARNLRELTRAKRVPKCRKTLIECSLQHGPFNVKGSHMTKCCQIIWHVQNK